MSKNISYNDLITKRNWDMELILIYLTPTNKLFIKCKPAHEYNLLQVIDIEKKLQKFNINFKKKNNG